MLKKKFSKKIYPPNKGSCKWQNCFFSGVKRWYLSDAAKPCVLLVRAFPIEHGLFGMFCQLRPGLYCCFFGPYGESTLYQSEALPVQLLGKKKGHAPSNIVSIVVVIHLSLSLSCSSSYSLHLHWSYVFNFNCLPSSNILIFSIRPILLTHLSILGYPNLFVPFVFWSQSVEHVFHNYALLIAIIGLWS